MKVITIVFFLIGSFCTISCKNSGDGIKREYYENGNIKSELMPRKDSSDRFTLIEFYPDGRLESVQNLKGDSASGEVLLFHKNGRLQKKLIFGDQGTANGMVYWFYPDGILQSSRSYRNDKQVEFGADYWDRPYGILQSAVLSNDSGHVFYKMNYDTTGAFLNSEGKKPDYWKGD